MHGESRAWNTTENIKRATDLMLMFVLNKTIDQLPTARCIGIAMF